MIQQLPFADMTKVTSSPFYSQINELLSRRLARACKKFNKNFEFKQILTVQLLTKPKDELPRIFIVYQSTDLVELGFSCMYDLLYQTTIFDNDYHRVNGSESSIELINSFYDSIV